MNSKFMISAKKNIYLKVIFLLQKSESTLIHEIKLGISCNNCCETNEIRKSIK